jgi:uncharacterized protein (TIGR02598 family)
MTITPPPSRDGGFSLIEVVLAVGIISFCLVSLMGLLSVSMNTSKASTTATTDSLLFQRVVNQLRVAAIQRNTAQAGDLDEDANRYPLPDPGIEGEKKFSVDEFNRYVEDGSAKALRSVTVNIVNPERFREKSGLEAPVVLSTSATDENGGKNPVICVTIRPAKGPENDANAVSYSTELNLAVQ